jgi:hypothetical protein
MDGRHVIDGVLGCPICYRQYPVRAGAAWFTATSSHDGARSLTRAHAATDDEGIVRAAALLGLAEPGGIVVLGGSWSAYAGAIVDHGAAHIVTLNGLPHDTSRQEISSIVVDDRLPFGAGTVRAIALGPDVPPPDLLSSSAQALRSRGRLVAPVGANVPDGIAVLASDDAVWVGERAVMASTPVTLRSGRR